MKTKSFRVCLGSALLHRRSMKACNLGFVQIGGHLLQNKTRRNKTRRMHAYQVGFFFLREVLYVIGHGNSNIRVR
jgi:hypothetical protein